MVYRGRIKDGAVVFDESVLLPDGVQVKVEIDQTAEKLPSTLDRWRGIWPKDIDWKDVYSESKLCDLNSHHNDPT